METAENQAHATPVRSHNLLADLTDAQREAVTHTEGPLLVLAAAGSGKTRVITRRAAYLVLECGVAPWNVLSITFTNKAAGEMRQRIGSLLSERQSRAMTIGTFHSLCVKLLRAHGASIGVRPDFAIYDTADQKQAMAEVYKELDLSKDNFEPAKVLGAISNAKNNLTDADAYARDARDFFDRNVARVFTRYTQVLRKNNALDFDDLLLETARLLRGDHAARAQLRERFRYIQVDEYQDTNHAQFVIAHALASSETGIEMGENICAVGDPDQSIYGWRGANLNNILEFEKHYPGASVVKLSLNYRSTPQILRAADTLIRHNVRRRHKDLITQNPTGAPVTIAKLGDEDSEAQRVVGFLRASRDAGADWGEMAVFYRVNALSRAVEEALLRAAIPYQVARGTAFYQRKEVKDALAYLRVIANRDDEVSLVRVINTPARGIGDTSVEHLRAHAVAKGVSLWEAIERAGTVAALQRNAPAIAKFARTVAHWREKVDHADERALGFIPGVRDAVEMVLRDSGLEAYYKDGKHADDEKLQNLYELVTAAQRFDETYGQESETPLPSRESSQRELRPKASERSEGQGEGETQENGAPSSHGETLPQPLPGREGSELHKKLLDYLESVALVSDVDAVESSGGAVTLMTLHASKGLEFPAVAILALEEGLLPHSRSRGNDAELEEERRLCFVGMTRAEKHLLLTHTHVRTIRGMRERAIPSPFLREIGEEGVTREDDTFGSSSAPWESPDSSDDEHDDTFVEAGDESDSPLHVGVRVRHPKFGTGKVVSLTPRRHPTTARVDFDRFGAKTLILQYARLEPA